MSQTINRNIPNWGKRHPLPELEVVIDRLNQLRANPRYDDQQWDRSRAAAFKEAGKLLEVRPARMGSGSSRWNPTIDALDHYRDDWRGEVVPVKRIKPIAWPTQSN